MRECATLRRCRGERQKNQKNTTDDDVCLSVSCARPDDVRDNKENEKVGAVLSLNAGGRGGGRHRCGL